MYNKEIENAKKDAVLQILTINSIIKSLKLKDERKLLDKIRDMQVAKSGKAKNNVAKKIIDYLSKCRFSSFDKYDVLDEMEKLSINYRNLEMNHNDFHNIIMKMGFDAKEELIKCIRAYVSDYLSIEYYTKLSDKDKKDEVKKDEVKKEELSTSRDKVRVVEKKDIYEYVKNCIINGTSIDYDMDKSIKEVYKDYYVFNRDLESSMEMQIIINKINSKSINNVSLNEMFKLANYTIKTMADFLLNKPDIKKDDDLSKLFSLTPGLNGLEEYSKAYDKFMKYFNSLSDDKRNMMISDFNDTFTKYYKNKFSMVAFHVPTPDEVKYHMNKLIKRDMIDSFTKWQEDSIEARDTISSACKYMTVENVISLYKELKDKCINFSYNGNGELYQSNIVYKNLANLQYNFVLVIVNKINPNIKGDAYFELIEFVVKEQLGEKVLFVNKKKDESISYVDEAVSKAQERFYNLNRLQQTLAKASGQYKKFLQLCEKVKETKGVEEQKELTEQLNKLF